MQSVGTKYNSIPGFGRFLGTFTEKKLVEPHALNINLNYYCHENYARVKMLLSR
jgi:hypothetical protein